MEITFRPLGKVMEIASSTGLEITYAFDDLVFSEHSIFVIRFDKEHEDIVYLYFNVDCEEEIARELYKTLKDASDKHQLKLYEMGTFNLQPNDEVEEIEIEFFDLNKY